MSKGLLDIITSSKDESQPSQLLIAVLGGKTREETATTDEHFTLPDLVLPESTKEREAEVEEERDLLKPLLKPAIKPRAYSHTHFNKEKIKIGAAIQHEQQRQRAQGLLQQGVELELMQEEMEKKARKEDARQRRVEWYERRTREKEEKEEEEANNILEDLVVQGDDVSSVRSSGIMETFSPVKPKNPRGKKSRTEETIAEEVEEDKEEERLEEVRRKRKIGGCINLQEAGAFQKFMNDKMIELVEQMRNDKKLVQPVWELIHSLKLKYDKLGLFENNGAANMEEIVETIHDTKGTAWQKSLEGKEILDTEDYNTIVKLTIESRLFQ